MVSAIAALVLQFTTSKMHCSVVITHLPPTLSAVFKVHPERVKNKENAYLMRMKTDLYRMKMKFDGMQRS